MEGNHARVRPSHPCRLPQEAAPVIYRATPEKPQPYPPANLWTRVELPVEAEPELIDHSIIRLPAIWSDERRATWMLAFDKPAAISS